MEMIQNGNVSSKLKKIAFPFRMEFTIGVRKTWLADDVRQEGDGVEKGQDTEVGRKGREKLYQRLFAELCQVIDHYLIKYLR